jgi:hypothetical protein
MAVQLAIADELAGRYWRQVDKFDERFMALADRHYSRQSPGSPQCMPPGRTFLLLAEMWTHAGECRAGWGVVDNLDPVGERRFRCSIFRNETPWLSSDLIREATELTIDRWRRRFGWTGTPALTTEIDPNKVKHKRGPARTVEELAESRERFVAEAEKTLEAGR